MKRLVLFLILCPLLIVGQDYKNIKGFQYLGQISAPAGYDLNPGQIEKNGDYYLFSFSDTNGFGFLHRYGVSKKGEIKLDQIIEVGWIEGRTFGGQISLTEDNKLMVFTSSYADSWENNELCISFYDPRTHKYKNVRLLGEINDNLKAEAYPWISPNGLRIYFTQENQIYYSSRGNIEHSFKYPKSLDIQYPQDDFECTSCWLSNDELSIYLTGENKVYKAVRTSRSEKFGTPIEYMSGFNDFISAFCISEKKNLAFLYFSGSVEDEEGYSEGLETILIYKIKKK